MGSKTWGRTGFGESEGSNWDAVRLLEMQSRAGDGEMDSNAEGVGSCRFVPNSFLPRADDSIEDRTSP